MSLVESANAEIERTIKSIKESGADKSKTKRARARVGAQEGKTHRETGRGQRLKIRSDSQRPQ